MLLDNHRGFTFVELMTVVAVISILAGVALPRFYETRGRAVDARVVSAVRHVANGEEAYYASRQHYTGDPAELDGLVVGDVAITITAGNSGDLGSSFRVHGSHPGAPHEYVWISDPSAGESNLAVN